MPLQNVLQEVLPIHTLSFQTPWGPSQLSSPCGFFILLYAFSLRALPEVTYTLHTGSQGPEDTNRPYWPWPASLGASTHRPCTWAQELHLSTAPGLQSWPKLCCRTAAQPQRYLAMDAIDPDLWIGLPAWICLLTIDLTSNHWTILLGDLTLALTHGLTCWPCLITVNLWDDLDSWLNLVTIFGSGLLALVGYHGAGPWLCYCARLLARCPLGSSWCLLLPDNGHSLVRLKLFTDPPKFRKSKIWWQHNWK